MDSVWACLSCFNPRLRAGGDPTPLGSRDAISEFQPTPPRGRRRPGRSIPVSTPMFQPTPPRGRRQRNARICRGQECVSTHASAREATSTVCRYTRWASRFQPTPPRGRRHIARLSVITAPRFQPTPPRGRRLEVAQLFYRLEEVSTHASAREATLRSWSRRSSSFVSTHASAREATALLQRLLAGHARVSTHASAREATGLPVVARNGALFQPTPPRGRRLLLSLLSWRIRYRFNPRLRAGGDCTRIPSRARSMGFQPTPPRGRRHEQAQA